MNAFINVFDCMRACVLVLTILAQTCSYCLFIKLCKLSCALFTLSGRRAVYVCAHIKDDRIPEAADSELTLTHSDTCT